MIEAAAEAKGQKASAEPVRILLLAPRSMDRCLQLASLLELISRRYCGIQYGVNGSLTISKVGCRRVAPEISTPLPMNGFLALHRPQTVQARAQSGKQMLFPTQITHKQPTNRLLLCTAATCLNHDLAAISHRGDILPAVIIPNLLTLLL